ncbi:hypothetical protein FA15DRAFT_554801, partial [Coprinopsis marcescibilis]
YNLNGLIYGSDNHFTVHLIDKHGQVWFNDGITTKENCIHEKTVTLTDSTAWLKMKDTRHLLYLVYIK